MPTSPLPGVAGGGQQFEDLVRVVDRRRHQVRRLAAGIAEHDALVAGALFALRVGGVVDALGDVGRLAVQQHVDLGGLPVEAALLVADGADRLAGGRLELRRVDDREISLGVLAGSLPSLSFFSSESGTRTSPAITTRLVVASVSQATRTSHAFMPDFLASR